jgi:hypothetical protein
MRLAGILGLAILLTLGLAVSSSQAVKKTKVESTVTIDSFDSGALLGQVTSQRPKCVRNRTVEIHRIDPGEPTSFGTTKTQDDGSWSLTLDPLPPGEYQATVERNKRKKKTNGALRKIIVCKSAVSGSFHLI